MSRLSVVAFFLAGALCAFGDGFPPAEVRIAGDINYGDTSAPVECATTPRYHALVFAAHGGDTVEATVTSEGHRAEVSIADPSLNLVAKGDGSVTVVLPDHGPDPETYYIVFRERDGKAAQFVVTLKRVSGSK